jgi:hypothetical protein
VRRAGGGRIAVGPLTGWASGVPGYIQTEAIKEWSDVLGVGATPTSMATVTFNNHIWTHQSWQNACGFTVLDAWSEVNGPHGTDANLNATYVIPFLGLDKPGPTDPEMTPCADGGPPGGSGSGSSGGNTTTSASGGSTGSPGVAAARRSARSSRTTGKPRPDGASNSPPST